MARRRRRRTGGAPAPDRPDRADGAEPFVLTAQLDPEATAFFQRLRTAFFPPELDRVPAHLTLFHKLPGEEARAVLEGVAAVAAARAPFEVAVAEPVPLGRGVAFRIEGEALHAMRADLAARFRPWLTGQDRERFRPHVTIQNKVSPARARATLLDFATAFRPFRARVEAIQLWRYAGGPWRPAGAVALGRG